MNFSFVRKQKTCLPKKLYMTEGYLGWFTKYFFKGSRYLTMITDEYCREKGGLTGYNVYFIMH